jgi:hypothetical protein
LKAKEYYQKKKALINKLIQDKRILNFEEPNKISKLIFDHNKESLREMKILEGNNTGGRLSRNSVLAYLYQQSERKTMDILTATAKEQGIFLLLIHDGFYTTRPVKLVELREELNQINPNAAITKEDHSAWGFNDISEHKILINQQEIKANGGDIPKKYQANYNRIHTILKNDNQYFVSDEFNNGLRLECQYDLELDPYEDMII